MAVSYELVGEGPTVIFTQGWMMSRKIWERQRPLSESFRLIFWELPQAGPAGEPLTLKHCAEALRQLHSDLNVESATYVGWSMGMSVFWQYLSAFGLGPFQRVVNVEMLPKMDPKEAMVAAVEKSMHRDREHATRKFTDRVFYDAGEMRKSAVYEELIQEALQWPLDSVLSVYKDMAEADYSAVSSEFKRGQELAFGQHGFYAGREELIRSFFPNDPLHCFEKSGHAPFWEEATKFNDLIQKSALSQ